MTITRVEALNYRCLRHVDQPLSPFQVLVGPNASGKSTFLDVIAFLSDLVTDGLTPALSKRSDNISDLIWDRTSTRFELAIEAAIPASIQRRLPKTTLNTIRYEVAIKARPELNEVHLAEERLTIKPGGTLSDLQRDMFPDTRLRPDTLLSKLGAHGTRTVLRKNPHGNDNFYSELSDRSGSGGWKPVFKLGPRRSALGNLPEDEENLPAATWFKEFLTTGIHQIQLNSLKLRLASPPGQGNAFLPDGSNLPWVIYDLEKDAPDQLRQWVAHLQTALPEIESIRTVEFPDTRQRYLTIRYTTGVEVPSWGVSDSTLRLLALTILAYLPNFQGVYLIEEPENGIHPTVVETVFQSLSSIYDAQVLVATHSPIFLSLVALPDLLCFAKTPQGPTDIVRGDLHPAIQDWRNDVNLSQLFAAGVLS